MSHGDVLWSHYVILNCSNLMLAPDTNLNSVESNWNSVDSVLMPNKCIIALPKMYTVTFGCKKNALGDVSISSLALYKQNFASARENIVPKFTNWLSWTLHKKCKCKGFIWVKFTHIWTESKDLHRKIRIRENLYICIFYPVLHISLIIPETYRLLHKNNRHNCK